MTKAVGRTDRREVVPSGRNREAFASRSRQADLVPMPDLPLPTLLCRRLVRALFASELSVHREALDRDVAREQRTKRLVRCARCRLRTDESSKSARECMRQEKEHRRALPG